MKPSEQEVIDRLRRDRVLFVAALREIAEAAPATEPPHPGRIDMTPTAAERYGIQQGLYSQGERARRALQQGGVG